MTLSVDRAFHQMKCLLVLHFLVQIEGVANCNGTYCLAKPSWLGVGISEEHAEALSSQRR